MFLIYVDKSGDAGVNTVLRIFFGLLHGVSLAI
ncbi:Uncharacterised protein [Moraxella cuniculi]|uniref:Uncharacterized protein n=1 Tax=Moraxella cuniculi TaxID=34061 RepID=A0A448GUP5_9GAMM|nr:Uncharacterised protein [Moraxella cuniculi]